MKKKSTTQSAFFSSRGLILLLLCATAGCLVAAGTLLAFLRPEASPNLLHQALTVEERVAYQRAIEEVYWRHRIWPNERPDPKPPLGTVMSQAQLEKKVGDYLRNSQALEDYWQRPITAEQLQAEMDRMAKETKQPEMLRELFEALGNDPFIIAECLARPALSDRLVRTLYRDESDLYRHTKWVICTSPIDLPIADIGLIPLSQKEPMLNRYILPVGPRLVLQGIFFHDVSRNSPNQALKRLVLTQEEAQECVDIICSAAVAEIFCQQRIADIDESLRRATAAGIEFLQIANPREVIGAGLKLTTNRLHFRVVSMNEFVAFVHSFVKPRRTKNAGL